MDDLVYFDLYRQDHIKITFKRKLESKCKSITPHFNGHIFVSCFCLAHNCKSTLKRSNINIQIAEFKP